MTVLYRQLLVDIHAVIPFDRVLEFGILHIVSILQFGQLTLSTS